MALRVCSKTIHCFGRTNIQPALFIAKFKSNLYAWMHLVVSQRRAEINFGIHDAHLLPKDPRPLVECSQPPPASSSSYVRDRSGK